MILVTGGAGFVGSNFVLQWIAEEKSRVITLDKLTGSGNLNNLSWLEHHPAHQFVKGDIRNRSLIQEILKKYCPLTIVHCATETQDNLNHHLEHSVQANILSTLGLLEESLNYWKTLNVVDQQKFRFLHVSSDEIYLPTSSLNAISEMETLTKQHAVNKTSSDELVQNFHTTYGLPTLITHCSNSFGPYQFPEKFIPSTIFKALQGKPLSVNSNEQHPWIYVGDYCSALRVVLKNGVAGEIYNVGAQAIITNQELVLKICEILSEYKEDFAFKPEEILIKLSKSSKPLEQKKELNDKKIRDLGWDHKETFDSNLRKTIQWYLHHMPWVENILSGEYKDWMLTENVEKS